MAAITRRRALQGLGAVVLGAAVPGTRVLAKAARSRPEAKCPNIVFVLADDLGSRRANCNDELTPNIMSIGQGGLDFQNAYVCAPFCSPSRAGALTGVYPQRFGIDTVPDGEAEGIPRDVPTIAETLQKQGYRTAIVGKWHLSERPEQHPMERGFDRFFGFLGRALSYADQNMPVWHDREKKIRDIPYLTDWFVDRAVEFIRSAKAHGRPFFLYLPFNAPHGPLEPPDRYLDRFQHLSPFRRRYVALVASLDEAVGKVLTEIDVQGLTDETVVVFSSDNGDWGQPHYAGPDAKFRGGKGTLYEGGIRVPLKVQWPGRLPAGVTVEQPVMLIDLPPTFHALGGGTQQDRAYDGVDLLGDPDYERPLFWRMMSHRGTQWAVRRGDWKLIHHESMQLYNLRLDPGEQRDLVEERPRIARELESLYADWERGLADPRWLTRLLEKAKSNRHREELRARYSSR